jgi:hypothetical protein
MPRCQVARQASMTRRDRRSHPLAALQSGTPPSWDACPFCPVGPFSAAKPSRPALSKHKSIVRPPSAFSTRGQDLVHRLSICSLLICPAKRLTTISVAWSYCMNARFSTLVTMSDNLWSQQGEDADFDWEDWIIEPTSEPTMGSEVG